MKNYMLISVLSFLLHQTQSFLLCTRLRNKLPNIPRQGLVLQSGILSDSSNTNDVRVQKKKNTLPHLISILNESLVKQSLVNISVFDRHSACGEEYANLKRVTGRYVKLKSVLKFQLNYRYKTNDQVKNYDIRDTANVIDMLLKSGFKSASLHTFAAVYKYTSKAGKGDGSFKKSIVEVDPDSAPNEEKLQHDRKKDNFIDINEPFLSALKITTTENSKSSSRSSQKTRARAGMSDKLRQIEKFLEILDGLVVKAFNMKNNDTGLENLKIVDMGCGMAYLTFAAHSHFSKRYHDCISLDTVGIEMRESIVKNTESTARSLGPPFDRLHFQQGAIVDFLEQYSSDTDTDGDKIDVLMALHACDIATDEAIFCGIQSGARVVVTAPCCHKQVRRQLDQHFTASGSRKESLAERILSSGDYDYSGDSVANGPLNDMLSHGIFREREAEMVTDSLRALFLQWAGYRVQVIEFVGGEHTAKNIMITAVRAKPVRSGISGSSSSNSDGEVIKEDREKEILLQRIYSLMRSFGLTTHRLGELLGIDFSVL